MVYIGLDLGGTKISGALFSELNTIQIQQTLLLEEREGDAVAELIFNLCDQLIELGSVKEDDEKSIGICVPGIAWSKTGNVWAPNIPGWGNYPLRDEIKSRFPKSTVNIESDRTCNLLGEISRGASMGCRNVVFIAVGTGIGAGILVDGTILHGSSDIAGAIGWMALQPPYSNHYDQCGCFETYASGTGIALQAKNRIIADPHYNGLLSQIPPDQLTSHDVFDAYKSEDPIAIQVIGKAIEMWGMASANLVSLFNPEMVVFGGGVFGPAADFVDRIYIEAQKWAQPIAIKQCRFSATHLPNLSGLYGAGTLAIQNSKTI